MKKEIARFIVNEGPYEFLIEPNMTLAELLREQLDLTGTKCACGVAECGSCTVLVDGIPTLSYSTLAITAREKNILTIEGLAKAGKLHPIQQAFMDHGSIECGFCTPGMIMMAKALLGENPKPIEQEVKEGIGGNLCRCTGYIKIIDGILAAAEAMGREGKK
ncbi:MAG: (2Fe-2S)-binding protein [Desulfatiglandales bacterium]|jgi:carbon-monoxide dehydrogenase small subunit|nr:(2Fe-2S)-binding protein [Desulfatiglandales bacterium]